MPAKDYRDLFFLAAIWGSSFLFMHLSVYEFGPFALAGVRVGLSALFLLTVAALGKRLGALRQHGRHIAVSGLLAAGLPFVCFNIAAQTVPASFMAAINAVTPLFGALIARVWLKEQLSRSRVLGLFIGFIGIMVLLGDKLSFGAGGMGTGLLACLTASFSYGCAASYTSRYLQGVDPIAVAAGSVSAGAIILLPPAIILWPSTPIPASSWAAASALALLCTGLAYIIFYRLIERVGASRSITVTFLVPLFGILWGVLFLDESLTPRMMVGTAVVLLGTLLATGFIGTARAGTGR